MAEVGVHEAKRHLSKLLNRVLAGEEITISKRGKPVARLVPVKQPQKRQLGRDKGLFEVPPDFDSPLPQDMLESFERR